MKRLKLKSESIRRLGDADLAKVAGGFIKTYAPYNCATVQACTGTTGCPTNYCTQGPCATTTVLEP